jgi:hypothetical protein
MKKSMKMALILLLGLMLMGGTVAASGTGGGTGGGQEDPLALVSSNVADGATNVAVNTKIRIEFNKNVTFDTVRAGNMSAFSMKDKNGASVNINVVLADAVNTEERNFANVEFPGGLKAGTEYTLTIAQSMESKSGDNLAAPIVIRFTTAVATTTQTGSSTQTTNPKTGDDFLSILLTVAALLYLVGFVGFKHRKRHTM